MSDQDTATRLSEERIAEQPNLNSWTCFHCGETFTVWGAARDHFGATPDAMAGCLIRVQFGDERGLQMELRKAEARIEALKAERGTLLKARDFQLQRADRGWALYEKTLTKLIDLEEGELLDLREAKEATKGALIALRAQVEQLANHYVVQGAFICAKEARALLASQPGPQCEITGKLCGTDTKPKGQWCQCSACQQWLTSQPGPATSQESQP